jgi:hypothetical protein
MGKKIVRHDFRVVVRPRDVGDFGFVRIGGQVRSEEEARKACEDIACDIRRRVDNLPTYGNRGVNVEWEEAAVCEHCGYDWTEDSESYNGGCCLKDEPPPREEDPGIQAAMATPFADNH